MKEKNLIIPLISFIKLGIWHMGIYYPKSKSIQTLKTKDYLEI